MLKQNFLILSVFFIMGCSAVDLRGKGFQEGFSTANQSQGRTILTEVARNTGGLEYWPKVSQMGVLTRDHWSNPIVRLLTPIQTANQKLYFTFDTASENTTMTFVDGKTPWDSVGIKNGKTYKIIQEKWIQKNFGDVKRYLGQVRHYFLFPQILKDYPVVSYLGEVQFKKRTYDKVFASTSDASANAQEDQYVAWVNRQTGRIDYIEFTIRDFFQPFHGVVIYKDYRQTEGMWLPFEIILPTSMTDQRPVHRFTVEKIDLKKIGSN